MASGFEAVGQAEEQALVLAMCAGSVSALEELIERHMPLVRAMARRYRRAGTSGEDLLAEGRLGLLVAARRFDPRHGVRFATYAAFWVRAYVRLYALRNRGVVTPPSSRMARRLLVSLPPLERRLRQERGAEVSSSELAASLGVGTDDVGLLRRLMQGRHVCVESDGGPTDVMAERPSPEELVMDADEHARLRATIRSALRRLPQREQTIVERRWLADDAATLAAMGKELGLSRERVRQLEQRAHGALRRTLQGVV